MILSIIATVYNKDEDSMTTLLEGLKRQSQQTFELILVDDCSSTDYQKLIDQYMKHYHITYIRFGTNRGQCHARNVGIRESKRRCSVHHRL